MSLKQVLLLLKKDLRVEARRGYELVSLVAFPAALMLAFGYTYRGAEQPALPFAFLWATLLFMVVFTTTTSFIREAERKTLYGLRTLPCSASTLYIGKFLYTISLNTMLGLIIMLLMYVFIGVQAPLLPQLCVLLLGLACLSAVSSFASALTMHSEGKTLLLPFLMFFFSLPSVTAAMTTAENLVLGLNPEAELKLLATYTLLICALSTLLINYLLEE